jgi:hypothetical protein
LHQPLIRVTYTRRKIPDNRQGRLYRNLRQAPTFCFSYAFEEHQMKLKDRECLASRVNRVLGTAATATAAAAGVGMVGESSQAEAAIIHSGVVNLNIPTTVNGLYLNVLNGAINEPGTGTGTSVPGWDVNFWSSTGFGLFSPVAPGGGAYVVTAPGFGANLALGAPISAASTFGSGISSNIAQWNLNGSNNLVGFRFQNEANANSIHYGWARIEFGSTITNRRLVEYAYENVAGASISAGAVPEPSSLGLLAMGAVGLMARRRKQLAA